MAREIIKKRVGPEGIEIPCDDDQDKWIDIKESKKEPRERGSGPAYQKTIYTSCNASERREYEDEPKITFKNPDDESQTIEYLKSKGANHGIVKKRVIEAGRGADYVKTVVHYCNSENSSRRVRVQTVTNPDTGDSIDVERIERWENEWGSGPSYQKKKIHPCNAEEQIEAMEGQCKL